MKTLQLFWISVAILCICGCGANQSYDNTITISNYEGQIELKLSDIADSIKYIPLSSKHHDSFIQYINSVIIIDDKILIKDGRAGILMFSSDGTFIKRVGSMGRGPHEYLGVLSMDVDCEAKRILVYPTYANHLLSYDFNGNYVETLNIPSIGYSIQDIYSLRSNELIFSRSATMNLPEDTTFVTNNTGQVTRLLRGLISGVNKASESLFINSVDNDNQIDTLFEYVNTSRELRYLLTIPRKAEQDFFHPYLILNAGDKTLIMGNMEKDRIDYIQSGSRRTLFSDNLIEWIQTSPTPYKPMIYNVNEKYFYKLAEPSNSEQSLDIGIYNDIDNGFAFWPRVDYLSYKPMRINNNKTLVSFATPLEIIEFVENAKQPVSEKLKSISLSIDEDANPILIVVYLKEKLL